MINAERAFPEALTPEIEGERLRLAGVKRRNQMTYQAVQKLRLAYIHMIQAADPEYAPFKLFASERVDIELFQWCVYFLECRSPAVVKIGFTTNFKKRFLEIQQQFPFDLDPIAVVPGSEREEMELHAVLKPVSLRGEWYPMAGAQKGIVEWLDIRRSAFAHSPLSREKRWASLK